MLQDQSSLTALSLVCLYAGKIQELRTPISNAALSTHIVDQVSEYARQALAAAAAYWMALSLLCQHNYKHKSGFEHINLLHLVFRMGERYLNFYFRVHHTYTMH